ncbi:histidine phosphatase family protein [Methyloversatilis sp.]|uniref:histidine phosphatase family protein n=1 Tax=Methyloversatilis sp. TaxID=2569862 RepID=UPI0035B3C754
MNRRHALRAMGCLMLQATGAHAGNTIALDALRSGGALLLRHALTEQGTGDPPGFRIADCSTQRNLSAAGRAQARAAGEALRARDVTIDAVFSSAWCRCIDTATLMFPGLKVDVLPALNSFFGSPGDRERQTAALRQWIAALDDGRRVALVTHQVNVLALTGDGLAMGEAIVVQADSRGDVRATGRLLL